MSDEKPPAFSIDYIKQSPIFKLLLLIPVVLGAGLLFTDYIVVAAAAAASMVVSYIVNVTGTKSFGAEMFTFAMVVTALNFGSVAGAFTGLFLLLFHVAVVQLRGPYLTWVIPSYFVAGLLVPFLGNYDIFTAGMFTVIGLQGFFLLMTAFLTPKGLSKFLPFAVTNVIFNLLIFGSLGPVLVAML